MRIICTLIFGFFLQIASSETAIGQTPQTLHEKCYMILSIREAVEDDSVTYQLLGTEVRHAFLRGLVQHYDDGIPAETSLSIFNSSGNLLSKHMLPSSRIVFYDDVPVSGGALEIPSMDFEVVVPHSPTIRSIVITRGELNFKFLVNGLKYPCVRICRTVGEIGLYRTQRCCTGLAPEDVTINNEPGFICRELNS